MTEIAGEGESGPGYRVRSDDTWAKAREAFLGGMAGREVCERFGLGRSAFWDRARKEGWRRADQPDPETDLDADLDQLDADPFLSPADLAALAWQRAKRAVLRGSLREALGWRRVHRDYLAIAVLDAAAEHNGEDRYEGVEQYTRWARPRLWRNEAELYEHGDADEAFAAAGTGDEQAVPTAEPDSPDTLDCDSAATPRRPPSTPAARRIHARMEVWKVRQAARGP